MALDFKSIFSSNFFTRFQVEVLRKLYGDLQEQIDNIVVGALPGKADKSTTISAGTGLSGGGDLSADRTIELDLTYTDARYAAAADAALKSTQIIAGTGLSGGGNLSADRTIQLDLTYTDARYALKGVITSAGLTMTAPGLVGRGTAGAGSVEAIAIGSGLTLSGTTLSSTGAVITPPGNTTTFLRGDGTWSNIVSSALGASEFLASGGVFRSNTAQAILTTTSASGAVYLRPKGFADNSVEASLDASGVLNIAGLKYIRGDFSSALGTRAVVQSNVANGNTNLALVPNGTAGASFYTMFGNSDVANSPFVQLYTDRLSGYSRLLSGATGTGTQLPLQIVMGGAIALQLQINGTSLETYTHQRWWGNTSQGSWFDSNGDIACVNIGAGYGSATDRHGWIINRNAGGALYLAGRNLSTILCLGASAGYSTLGGQLDISGIMSSDSAFVGGDRATQGAQFVWNQVGADNGYGCNEYINNFGGGGGGHYFYKRQYSSGALTRLAAIDTNGNFVAVGGAFASVGAGAVLGPASGAGTVYLRPNGIGSGTGQAYVTSGGDLVVAGGVYVSGAGSGYIVGDGAGGYAHWNLSSRLMINGGNGDPGLSDYSSALRVSGSYGGGISLVDGAGTIRLYTTNSGGIQFRIGASGTGGAIGQDYAVLTSGGVYAPNFVATSDVTQKNLLRRQAPRHLARDLALWHFRWKKTGAPGLSLTAQQIEQRAPEYILRDDKGIMHVDKAGVAIEAAAALQVQVDAQALVIDDLVRRLAALEKT